MSRKTASVFGLITLVVSTLSAQVRTPESFGTDEEGITIVGWQDFFPRESSEGYVLDELHERRCDGGSRELYAGINMIPNGAILVQVVFYVRDSDVTDDIDGNICRSYVDSDTGNMSTGLCLGLSATTNGAPGETTIALNPNHQIVYHQDVTNDGDPEVVNYFLRVTTRGDTYIRMARLRWRRQVSPAPSTATFGDVPTSHLFFQFIEALAESGITAGCNAAPPLYCPDAPLTRGQMAVFLAKALGLHWSWIPQI